MKRVLILGNGLSRLLFHAEIEAYEGEVWGCNFCYLEYPHKLTRLAGHVQTMIAAQALAHETGLSMRVYGGNQGSYPESHCTHTCPPWFYKDSGTTLVADALEEGFELVEVCGFDMGGADVGSPRHWRMNKTSWIGRWRKLYDHYQNRWCVRFWGQDHLPVITTSDGKVLSSYVAAYRSGAPHITDERYIALHYAFYGVPAALDGKSPNDIVDARWIVAPYQGRIMSVQRWWAEIESGRGKCVVVKDVIDEGKAERRARVEALIEEVVDSLPQRSLEVMAERRGIGDLSGLSRREIVQAIGAVDAT